LRDREPGDQGECAKSPDFPAYEAQVVKGRELQDWLAGAASIELANSSSEICHLD
jgi:hypothetical protein